MVWANNFFWGWLLAFAGMAIPGLGNMTTANVTMRYGVKAGLASALGGAVVVFIQAKIAVGFANYLSTHGEVLTNLKKLAVLIFLALSAVFLKQALRPKKRKGQKPYPGTPFLSGCAASGVNALNIPFYFTASAFLDSHGWLLLRPYSGWGVALGAFVGSFSVLALYAYLARWATQSALLRDKTMNYFLSALFFGLALWQWVLLYFV